MSLSVFRILFFSFLSFNFQLDDIVPASTVPGNEFSVMTYNVGNAGERFPTVDEVLHVVQREMPEILMLEEVRSIEFVETFSKIYGDLFGKEFVYEYFQVGNGTAIVSRYPLEVPRLIPGTQLYGGGAAICRIGKKSVLLCVVHLPYIPKERDDTGEILLGFSSLAKTIFAEFFYITPRSLLAGTLTEWIMSQNADAKIIAGDFNTIPFSRVQTVMQHGFTDSLYMKKDYLSSSYRKIRIPVGTRADYIFGSKEIISTYSRVISESKGDHYPVYAEYSWKREGKD